MKKYFLLTILLALIFVFSGCSKGDENGQSGEVKINFDEKGRRMPDFGQPDKKAELVGLVTKVVGNEVTVLKIERPEGSGFEGSRTEEQEGEEDTEKKAATFGGTSGRMPGMGRMGGGSSREGFDEDAMIERMKTMATGEETIIIPVGIQMLKPDKASGDKPNMLEANLGDIKKDTMINVWLNESVTDRSVASFVLVR